MQCSVFTVGADFDSPLQQTGTGGGTGQQFEPDEGSLSMIESMGFSQQQAVTALKATVRIGEFGTSKSRLLLSCGHAVLSNCCEIM